MQVWLANGHTDMRHGMNGLALQVQRALQRDPHAGDLYVFKGRRGDLLKILWHDGLGEHRTRLARGYDVARAIDYLLKRWPAFTRFLDDGRVCISNNAAERALRGIALGRRSWLFCGSDRGGQRAAVMYSLIVTAKMNDVDPQIWLADVLVCIAGHPARRLDDLLPWNWAAAKADRINQAA